MTSPSLTMYSLPSSRWRCLALASLTRAGLVEVVEGGDLGADEALGEVGVDLAGGLDGGRAALEVPAAHLGLSGGEEGDDADGVVGLADDPVAAQLADAQVGHERGAFLGVELRELELELGVDGQGLGSEGRRAIRESPGPGGCSAGPPGACRSRGRTIAGASCPRRRDPSEATVLPSSRTAWTTLTISSSLASCLAVGPGLLEAGLEPLDAVGDDAEVGEEHLVAEGGELGGRVAAGEPVQDDQQGVAFADQGEALGVVGVRAGHQPGRVEELDRGRRDLLGLVQRGQEVQPRVGQRGDADLAGVDLCPGREPFRSGAETTCSCRFRRTRRFRHASVNSSVGSAVQSRGMARCQAAVLVRAAIVEQAKGRSRAFQSQFEGIEPRIELSSDSGSSSR